VLVAYELSGQVLSRSAALLGLPETTFARRYQKAAADADLSRRSPSWHEVRDALFELLRDPGRPSGENLTGRLDTLLLEEVVARLPGNAQASSLLLGISLPTFRQRLARLGDGSGGV